MQAVPIISETPTWKTIFDTCEGVDGFIYDVVDSCTLKVIAVIPETTKNISIICTLEDCAYADSSSENIHEISAAKQNKKKLRTATARKRAKLYFNGFSEGKYIVTCYVDNININDYMNE